VRSDGPECHARNERLSEVDHRIRHDRDEARSERAAAKIGKPEYNSSIKNGKVLPSAALLRVLVEEACVNDASMRGGKTAIPIAV
jgi:hypothetical protein